MKLISEELSRAIICAFKGSQEGYVYHLTVLASETDTSYSLLDKIIRRERGLTKFSRSALSEVVTYALKMNSENQKILNKW